MLNTAESDQRSLCNDQATDCTTEERWAVFIFRAELHLCIAPKSLFFLFPFFLYFYCYLFFFAFYAMFLLYIVSVIFKFQIFVCLFPI